MNYDVPEEIVVESEGPVRIVTLNRPEIYNAVNKQLHEGFCWIWPQLERDPEARVVVLTGAGKAFSAGGDLAWQRQLIDRKELHRSSMQEARKIVKHMVECRLPIVAAVNGPAVGFGCSVALLCDLVLIDESAFLMDPHVGVGLVAADGGALAWPLMTSILRAKEYLFLGKRIPAADAVALGLANRMVAKGRVLEEALALAHELAALPAQALQDTKRALKLHLERAFSGVLEYAISAETEAMNSADHLEQVRKFLKDDS
ncbi:MAG: enoyl-CoA hydratase/isomerase family protein [Gemmatimonadota bacterium]